MLLVYVLQTFPAFSQDVSPDGTTNTAVTDNPNQKIHVDIAPKDAKGISHNKYSNFNVPLRGVDLNNQSVHATTILNEVTSTNPSNIFGDLSVLGPKAHVILANPNGIHVDGGRFINTGGVILATSHIDFDANDNPVLTTNQGTIDIGPGGLSGLMTELDLIAKQIRVNGKIENEHPGDDAAIQLIAGLSSVTIKADQAVDTADGNLIQENARAGETTAELSVDISKTSLLRSGAIRLRVNDIGAGVRMAGDMVATGAEFSLGSNGNIEIRGANISAKKRIDVTGNSVSITSTDRQSDLHSEESGITIESLSGNISIEGTQLQALERSFLNFNSINAITLQSADNIEIQSDENFQSEFTATLEGISFLATGHIITQSTLYSSAEDISFNSNDFLETKLDQLTAQRDIQFLSQSHTKIDQAKLHSDGDIRLQAASLQIESHNERAELVSSDSAVTITTTTGDFNNNGGLIEGFQTSLRDPDSKGAVTLDVAGNLRNESFNINNLGVIFGRAGDVNIELDGSLYNLTSRLLSNANMTLNLGGDFINETPLAGTTSQKFKRRRGKRSWRSLWLKHDVSYLYQTDFGTPKIDGELAIVTAIGNIDIEAQSILNKAGQINGNNVTLDGTDSIKNTSLLTGKINFSQSCGLFNCEGNGHSNVDLLAASITAAGQLKIVSEGTVENKGGRLNGGEAISIDAQQFNSTSLFIPTVVFRPQGFSGLFQGQYGWVNTNFDGGFLSSNFGAVEINTESPVNLIGTGIFSADDVQINKKGKIVATPPLEFLGHEPIGILKRAY